MCTIVLAIRVVEDDEERLHLVVPLPVLKSHSTKVFKSHSDRVR